MSLEIPMLFALGGKVLHIDALISHLPVKVECGIEQSFNSSVFYINKCMNFVFEGPQKFLIEVGVPYAFSRRIGEVGQVQKAQKTCVILKTSYVLSEFSNCHVYYCMEITWKTTRR